MTLESVTYANKVAREVQQHDDDDENGDDTAAAMRTMTNSLGQERETEKEKNTR